MSNLTFTDFVRWSIAQINPAALSELMTAYDYTDDSLESVIDALVNNALFYQDFGKLLGKSIRQNEEDLNRVTGNVKFAVDNLTLNDWAQLSDTGNLLFAAGDEGIYDTGESITYGNNAKKNYDWASLINGIVGTATSFFFGGQSNNDQAAMAAAQKEIEKQKKQTALYIIIGVVVVAIAVIVYMALGKKK